MNYTKKQKDLLMSIIIGDGCIYKSNQNSYSISVGHGESQGDYCDWKRNLLNKNFSWDMKLFKEIITNKKNNKQYKQIRFRKANKNFKELYDIYHSKENRIKKILSCIHSDRALAIWLMDDGSVLCAKRYHADGSLWYNKPTLKLCTHCFTEEENNEIASWFMRRYHVKAYLVHENKRGKTYTYLRFNSEESFKLFKLSKQYIEQTKSMLHKFRMYYQYYNL